MLHTYIRRALALALAPALVFVATTPAPAQFLDGVIVANQLTQIRQFIDQLRHAVTQIRHLEDSADYLQYLNNQAQRRLLPHEIRRFTSDPGRLLSGFVPWSNDFLNPTTVRLVSVLTDLQDPGANNQVTDHWRNELATADTTNDTEITALFSTGTPDAGTEAIEALRLQRDRIEPQLAAAYATSDAAEALAEMLPPAQHNIGELLIAEYDGAELQQAHMSTLLTTSQIQIATAQVLTHTTLRDNLARQQRELERRRYLARWLDAELAAHALAAEETAYLAATAGEIRTSMLMTSYLGPIQ